MHAKIGLGGPLLAAKIGPTPDHFWLPKMVQVAKSGPGISTSIKPFLAFRSLCRTHFYKRTYSYMYMHACMANMRVHTCALLIIHAGSSDMVKIFLKETHATASTRHISRVLSHADKVEL